MVTRKVAPSLVRLYERIPEPKYVIAMEHVQLQEGCLVPYSYNTGGLISYPSKLEAVIDIITKLRKKYLEKSMKIELDLNGQIGVLLQIQTFHSSYSIHTRNYEQGFFYQSKSTFTLEIPTETFFKYKSSVSSYELVN
ncbi:hypothetical protein M9H77_31095 [Catharanthus roseus]|uniref:Uncharacterized protein n=1 Tax=Catharanthus roseus TaxID=4058 RepID=A0ACB9ZZ23_CATRO|nr:hypothetical protein M9H77_31095 [Catharanthus roseus]